MQVKERSIGIGIGLALLLCASASAQVPLAPAPAPAETQPKVQDALSRAAAGQVDPAAPTSTQAPDLVVWQGDAKLTLQDIDARMSRIPVNHRAGFINDPERIETLLRGLLLARQIAHQAERDGLLQDPIVAAELELAKDEILARRQLSLHMRDLKMPDVSDLARERYLSSPKLYSSKPTLEVRHVLIDSKKHGDAEAKALAEKLHAQITSGELSFEKAVEQYSDDAGAKENGGKIEDLTPGETLADFDAAAFALKKVGDVSPVVSTKYGYHIIRLDERIESKRYPFEDVKAQIEQELQQEYIKRASQEFLDRWRNNALDANPQLVQSLRTRYLPGAAGTQAIQRAQGDVPAATEGTAQDGASAAPGAKP